MDLMRLTSPAGERLVREHARAPARVCHQTTEALRRLLVALPIQVEHVGVALLRDRPRQPEQRLGLPAARRAGHEQMTAHALLGEQHQPARDRQRTLTADAVRDHEPTLAICLTHERLGYTEGNIPLRRRDPMTSEGRGSIASEDPSRVCGRAPGRRPVPCARARRAHDGRRPESPVFGVGSSRTPKLGQRLLSDSSVSWRCGPGAQKYRVASKRLVSSSRIAVTRRRLLTVSSTSIATCVPSVIATPSGRCSPALAVARKHALGDPLRRRRKGLDVEAHVVDGRDMGERSEPGTPDAEPGVARRHPSPGREHPCGLADEDPFRPDETRRV